MAPTKNKVSKSGQILKIEHLKKIVYDPHHILPVCILLFLFEIVLNIFIIEKVSYTEIDWKAYMQEVEGFMNGTWDYKELKGSN